MDNETLLKRLAIFFFSGVALRVVDVDTEKKNDEEKEKERILEKVHA